MAAAPALMTPADSSNLKLIENAHPPNWINPEPQPRYNLVVIGAGTAGLVTAAGAAGLGAKVALVERHLMGGDCLNFGCVPSKALMRTARTVADVREASKMGVQAGPKSTVDFAAVMTRMRRLRAELSDHDSASRFRTLGVDVFLGEARFVSGDTIAVDGKTLRFSRAVIASGARAAALPIRGLAEAGFLTNETVFSLTAMPPRLAVIGGGPLGCELAQAFARFGAEVTVLEVMRQIMPREDPDAASRLAAALANDGISLLTDCKITAIERSGGGKTIRYERAGAAGIVTVNEILLGVGRAPNVEGLGLDAAGVRGNPQHGIEVNDHLQTSNPHIYAAGDVATAYRFTHMADAMARIVIRNALFFGRARASLLTIPWCTYTDPEIAHVGLDPVSAEARGVEINTFFQEMSGVDRALLDGETDGFVKVHVAADTDRIVGATIVARHASDMIGELTLALSNRIGLGALANVIHPYPTQAEAIRKVADAYNRTRLTPRVARFFDRLMAWRRR